MHFAYKYRLYPNQAQVRFLENQLHEACELYNAALKIRNQRAAFHHDLSRWLVERYGLIAVEDLNIKGLSRGILAARSTTPDGTLSLPNSRTRLQAPGESW